MDDALRKMDFEFCAAGKHKISAEEFFAAERGVLLDVRSEIERQTARFDLIPISNFECLHIPTEQIPDRVNEIPRDVPVAVFCSGVIRAAMVYAYLVGKGFDNVRILDGGYEGLVAVFKPGKLAKIVG